MYGGNGGHGDGTSVHDGWLVIVDQTTGAVTPVGHPGTVKRITGLAFDSTGALYGSTIGGAPFPPPPPFSTSNLIRIDPATGAQLSIVDITDGGNPISISDLAVQPCTDVLYGIRGSQDNAGGFGNLYTIDKTTGVATLVARTGHFFGSIAFGPDGTLYMAAADLDFATGNQINFALETRNPANGALQSSVPTAEFYGALAVRPTDGVIFAGNGDFHTLFTLNPATGAETIVGDTGGNFVGDFAFRPEFAPAPGLNCLSPAEVWIGLKNSDDVGTKFDLKAEVLHNGTVIGTGELDSVPGGSSGFNNAHLRAIAIALSSVQSIEPADTICLRLSVRIATKVAGHRSGTARLWYNDAAANSRFDARIGTADVNLYLLDGFALSTVPGSGPKKTVDVFVDKAVNGNPWKPFGSWCLIVDSSPVGSGARDAPLPVLPLAVLPAFPADEIALRSGVLAGVAKLVDARDLKSRGLKRPVPVRLRPPAPENRKIG